MTSRPAALGCAPMLSTLVASLLLLPPIPSYAESAHRLATMEVREAIDEAYLRADPDGSHAWWRAELYMIAKREARGGADGLVGVHEGDSWLGRKSWENIVTACKPCNQRKGGRTPAQAQMHLIRRPKQPAWLPSVTLSVGITQAQERWKIRPAG